MSHTSHLLTTAWTNAKAVSWGINRSGWPDTHNRMDENGAPGRNNLEPSECDQILTELEEWTSILRAEPEVIHRLAAFAKAADDGVDQDNAVSLDLPKPEVSP